MVDFYADEYFVGQRRHENPQDSIFAKSRNVFVVTFANCPLLWVSKLNTEIYIFNLHLDYVQLSHSVRTLLPLKIIIKEVIYNLGIDSEKLKFVSCSNFCEENNGAVVVSKIPRMTPT